MITIEVTSQQVLAALRRLQESAANPRPILKLIGERLVESTRRRFDTATAPDGSPWAPNSPVTMAIAAKKGSKRRGARPLIDTGIMRDTLHYQIDNDTLYVGTDRFSDVWRNGAAIHQFGGMIGRNRKVAIPARPFLGVSNDDVEEIKETVFDYFKGVMG